MEGTQAFGTVGAGAKPEGTCGRACWRPCEPFGLARSTAMTRDEVLTLYGPIRTGIQRILRAAAKACSNADVNSG